jgi:hypothetical protein
MADIELKITTKPEAITAIIVSVFVILLSLGIEVGFILLTEKSLQYGWWFVPAFSLTILVGALAIGFMIASVMLIHESINVLVNKST